LRNSFGPLYTASQEGKVAVIIPARESSVASIGEFGEQVWSAPAINGTQLFIGAQPGALLLREVEQTEVAKVTLIQS